jgi:hypothetical protein
MYIVQQYKLYSMYILHIIQKEAHAFFCFYLNCPPPPPICQLGDNIGRLHPIQREKKGQERGHRKGTYRVCGSRDEGGVGAN